MLVFGMISTVCIILSSVIAVLAVKRGKNRKRAFAFQICSSFAVMAICLCCSFSQVKAMENKETSDTTTSASQNADNGSAVGLGLLAVALAAGLSGIGGGIAVASAAPAAIAATSEDPKAFGKSLIFVALGEGIALYGLLVSIMILGKL
ncbi:MAG: ATP synthase subunit C [Clostridia bacterium]|nr:ATP synthase subunit C [Clostridia bacterium]